jgi:hypothetical protein
MFAVLLRAALVSRRRCESHAAPVDPLGFGKEVCR